MLAQGWGGMGYYLICAIAGLIVMAMAANEWLRLDSVRHRRMAVAGGVIFLARLVGLSMLFIGSQRIIAYQEWVLGSITLIVVVWAFLIDALHTSRWGSLFAAGAAVAFAVVLAVGILIGDRISLSVPPGLWLATLVLGLYALIEWIRHRRRFSIWLGGAFLVASLSAVAGLLGAAQVAMLAHLAMLVLVALESYGAVLSGLGGLGRRLQASSRQAWLRTQELAFLLEVSRNLSDSLDLRVVLERVADAVSRVVNADWAYVLMPEGDEGEQLVVAARYGWWGRRWTQDSHPSRRTVIDADELSLIRHAILIRRAVLANDPEDYGQFERLHDLFARPQSGPALILPIVQESTLGVLLLGRVDLSPRDHGLASRRFTEADARLCQDLMLPMATAIQNARLYQSALQRSEQVNEQVRRRESENLRLRSILDSTADGVVVVAETGHVALANAAAERILNVPREHLLGRIIAPLHAKLLRDASRRPGDQALFEWDDKLLMSRLSPVRLSDGSVLGDVVVFRDVTAEHRARRVKAEYHLALSRDLEDLLAFVRGDTQLLVEGAGQSEASLQGRLPAAIVANIEQMGALLRNFRTLSALECEELQVEAQPVDIGDVIYEAVRTVRSEAQASDLELVVSLPSELSPAWGDPEHLGQIVINLLDHAVRHTPAGSKIDIWATQTSVERQDGPPQGCLVVSIHDPGTEIPPGEQWRVFDLSHQVDGGRAIGSASARVGLAVSKGLVIAHGGQISVTSQPGEGSTFSFSVPTAEVA